MHIVLVQYPDTTDDERANWQAIGPFSERAQAWRWLAENLDGTVPASVMTLKTGVTMKSNVNAGLSLRDYRRLHERS